MLPCWAWAWVILVLVLTTSASWTDLRDGVPTWRVTLDAVVALVTVASVIVVWHTPSSRDVAFCDATKVTIVAAGVWTCYRSTEEYRHLVRVGEIASRGDRIAAVVTSLLVAVLYLPAWAFVWRTLCT